MSKTVKVVDWLFEILLLHFYWIIYSFRGLIVAGIFPSTAAVFAVCRQRIMRVSDEPESLSKLFKRYYSENFKVANLLGYLLLVVSFIVIMNFYFIQSYPSQLQIIMYSIVIFMSVILFICWVYLFPAIVHYQLPVQQLILVIFKTGFSSLLGIGVHVIAMGILLLIISQFPAFLLLFGIIPFAMVQMLVGMNAFARMD